jgi:hypothetical protein
MVVRRRGGRGVASGAEPKKMEALKVEARMQVGASPGLVFGMTAWSRDVVEDRWNGLREFTGVFCTGFVGMCEDSDFDSKALQKKGLSRFYRFCEDRRLD